MQIPRSWSTGLYRAIGLDGISEGMVPGLGKELDRLVGQSRDRGTSPAGASMDGDAFHSLLRDVLESPKLPNQSTKRFLQVSPLVGEAATFSGSARLAGNPWPAGALVRRMVWLGSPDADSAASTWDMLFTALGVDDEDDVFARFLRDELAAWTNKPWGPKCVLPEPGKVACLPAGELTGLASPARQFARDLGAIVAAKPLLTRRQWISLLEALVRIAAVAHVAWACEVQKHIWGMLRGVLAGDARPDDVRARIYPRDLGYLRYGTSAVSELKDRTSRYLRARLGINCLLWSLEDAGVPFEGSLSSANEVSALCRHVEDCRSVLGEVIPLADDLADREARALLCGKGVGSNVMEFARHVLYQRQAANPLLRGYDQGYVLRKRSAAKSSQWICAPGPVAVLALVHCSLAGLAGPRSVHRLAQHMAAYGIVVDHREIAKNELGHQLRMLGLVLDSPDAESGMLLVPPFQGVQPGQKGGRA
ncbi:conserved hypothetical protein [Magnetospirillum sp. LM-5]|nr:conserved hypothetical protein [Magnetospirillum sp. LM-5]